MNIFLNQIRKDENLKMKIWDDNDESITRIINIPSKVIFGPAVKQIHNQYGKSLFMKGEDKVVLFKPGYA